MNEGKMESGEVSIVVPTYNRADKIESLAASILSQTYRPLEFIIIDDGSCDDTMLKLNALMDSLGKAGIFTFFCSIPHSGQDAAMNEGLKHITGEYFFWCDDDDELMPDAISSKVEWLRNHPDFGFVRSDAQYIDEASGKILRNAYLDEHLKCSDILAYLLDDTMPCLAGTYLMRTSLLDQIYPDRTIPLNGEGQNLQLLIPAALISKCGYIDQVQLRYIIHPDSHSSMGRSLTDLLARNEKIRELKLLLLGNGHNELAEIVNKIHDFSRCEILKSAAVKAKGVINQSDECHFTIRKKPMANETSKSISCR